MRGRLSDSLMQRRNRIEKNALVQCFRRMGAAVLFLLPMPQFLFMAPASAAGETARSSAGQLNPQLQQGLMVVTPDLPLLKDPSVFLPVPDPLADVRLVLKLSERRVYVYNKDQVKTSFPVAIGRNGWETPTGEFKVMRKERNPTWQHPFTGQLVPPGASNPLGSRWIGFWTDGNNYIGFHGTPNEESVGRPASHGCVRMYNRDVVALFDMVEVGTPVEVVP